MTIPLSLTARAEGRNERHARIGVFQNGAKAGVLTVDAVHEHTVINLINAAPNLLDVCQRALAELSLAPCRDSSDHSHCSKCFVQARVRHEIKKAKGEQ